MKPKPITTKLLTILISILLVIQPLSGCITNSENITLKTQQAYVETIETRPPYTNYGAFLSSDYMMKRLKYFPEYESRMNSNEWILNSTNRSGTTIIGENVNLKIKDSIILDGGITANNKLNIDTQGNLSSTAELKSKGDMSINAKVENNAFMLIVPTMLALATYANAPDIGEKTQDGLPASILNPAIDTAVFLYDATKELLDGGVPTEAIIVALAHKYKVDEATAKNVVSNFSNPKNIANYERYKDELVKNMGKPQVSDSKLQNFVNTLYRDNARIGSGSTADAVREELLTGNSVGGKYHTQKAQDSIVYLEKWLKNNPNASFSDRQAAIHIIRDTKNALNGK